MCGDLKSLKSISPPDLEAGLCYWAESRQGSEGRLQGAVAPRLSASIRRHLSEGKKKIGEERGSRGLERDKIERRDGRLCSFASCRDGRVCGDVTSTRAPR